MSTKIQPQVKKMKKKIPNPLHSRIKVLADAAIARGEIIQFEKISDTHYTITRTGELQPTTFTAVGVGTLLYLLNSASRNIET